MAQYVCGVDEVGRGALAGPVCVAAVVAPIDAWLPFLNDSKKLSPKKRKLLAIEIKQRYAYSVSWVMPQTIDAINILQATLLAMQLAVNRLSPGAKNKINTVLIDGNQAPHLDFQVQTIIKGDSTQSSIMMASILAKEARDDYMRCISQFYADYHFQKHMGYPTKLHKTAIAEFDPSPIHRLSFKLK